MSSAVSLVEHYRQPRSFHLADVNAATTRPLIVTHVDRASHLMPDENPVYIRGGREFNGHATVDRGAGGGYRAGPAGI